MDLLNLIETRRSVRKYSDKEISKEDLNKILKAGWLAPSWMNSQPWKFIAVQNDETKKILSELSGFQPHVKDASCLIVCVADKNAWNKETFGKVLQKRGMKEEGIEKVLSIPMYYPPLHGDKITLMRSVEQVTYAVSYMMLMAKSLGIDSCIIGAIANEATLAEDKKEKKKELIEKVNKTLNLKAGEVIITIITLGYDDENAVNEKQRKDYDEVVFFEHA